jgi:hypothetical protein
MDKSSLISLRKSLEKFHEFPVSTEQINLAQ